MTTNPDELDYLQGLFELSPEEQLQASAIQAQAQEMAITYTIDPDEMAFRRLNLSSAPIAKLMAMSPDGKMTSIPEIPDDIVGFKGVIISAQFGFMLYNSTTRKVDCTSSSSTLVDGSINKTSKPLPFPLYAPKAYNEDRALREPVKEVRRYDLQGSKYGSCADCVMNGTSSIPTAKGTDDCSLATRVIFAAMEVLVPETILGGDGQLTSSYTWKKVVDLERGGRKVYSGSLVFNVSLSRKTILTKLQASKLEVETFPRSPAPEGCQTLATYLRLLQEDSAVYRSIKRPTSGGTFMTYATVSEVYLTQPKAQYLNDWSPMIKSVPVFRTCTDEEVGNQLGSWLAAAHMAYNQGVDAFMATNTSAKIAGIERKVLGESKQETPAPAPNVSVPPATQTRVHTPPSEDVEVVGVGETQLVGVEDVEALYGN